MILMDFCGMFAILLKKELELSKRDSVADLRPRPLAGNSLKPQTKPFFYKKYYKLIKESYFSILIGKAFFEGIKILFLFG